MNNAIITGLICLNLFGNSVQALDEYANNKEYMMYDTETDVTQYLDIDLSNDLQDYINEIRENVPFELVIAVIDQESNFTIDIISTDGCDYGLMQINKCNHEWLGELYGITDFLDAKSNIQAGLHILKYLYNKYDEDIHKTLMCYNMGESNAKSNYWDKSIYTSNYSEKVVEKYEAYRTATANGRR